MAYIEVKCDRCPTVFRAKVADRRRGWARCCSKSCAAKRRERTRAPSKAQQLQRRRYAQEAGNLVRFTDGTAIKLPANVTRDQFISDMKEHGGTPQYDRHGNYEGFTMSPEEAACGGYGDSDPNDGLAVGEGKDRW